jgi:hypothetical protein
MDTPSIYKLHIRIGQSEFNAEGPEALVKDAYEMFLQAAKALPAQAQTTKQSESQSEPTSEGLLQRIYQADSKRGIVSLIHLPTESANRSSDAAMLILYGYKKLLNIEDVPVTKLMAGLRQSGIHVSRLDGIMSVYSQSVLKGGSRIGGRYRLNNQGLAQAEGLLKQYTN